jgi:CubicO group peptidase (beta-lactamase class C family)
MVDSKPPPLRRFLRAAGIAALVAFLAIAFEWRKIERLRLVLGLFSGADQVEHFRSFRDDFPTHRIAAADRPVAFPTGAGITLPSTFTFDGRSVDSGEFLAATDTTGLLVLLDGRIAFEQYWRGNDARTHWISFSVCKSFVSALVGIAIRDGAIHGIEEQVTRYAPELLGSAYDGVRIKDVLQMSSGAAWDEDYSSWSSDINRFGRTFAMGGSLDDFVKTLRREHAPGSFHRYNSMDSQVLGLVLRHATGRSLADYLSEKLWSPLGAESDAYWITDDAESEFAAGGLFATLRDYARLGELYRNQGRWNGVQILGADWVHDSVTPDAPHLLPGPRANSNSDFGYGFQWWVPDASGAFSAIGVYNQFVYVNPALRLVIAKISANHAYGTSRGEATDREHEHIAFFHAIEGSLPR